MPRPRHATPTCYSRCKAEQGYLGMSTTGEGSSVLRVNVGVLCIQGAFIEHLQVLERLAKQKKRKEFHIHIVDVRKPAQFGGLDGLIIPGGESTTLSVFLSKDGFEQSLKSWVFDPTTPRVLWGTCAGLILIANKLTEQKKGGQVTVGLHQLEGTPLEI